MHVEIAILTLPPPANENVNPYHKVGTAMLELHRTRRAMLAKDKSGYSADQWRRYHEALKQIDDVIARCLPHL